MGWLSMLQGINLWLTRYRQSVPMIGGKKSLII